MAGIPAHPTARSAATTMAKRQRVCMAPTLHRPGVSDESCSSSPGDGGEFRMPKAADFDSWDPETKYRTLLECIDEGYCVVKILFDDAGAAVDYIFLETNR